jgi:hypothetical protein
MVLPFRRRAFSIVVTSLIVIALVRGWCHINDFPGCDLPPWRETPCEAEGGMPLFSFDDAGLLGLARRPLSNMRKAGGA